MADRTPIFGATVPGRFSSTTRWPAVRSNLLKCGGFLIAAFELKHHSFDVLVLLMRLQNLQALLRIAPVQNLDRFRTSAPCVHIALIGHVEINRVPSAQCPAVIFDAISLSGR